MAAAVDAADDVDVPVTEVIVGGEALSALVEARHPLHRIGTETECESIIYRWDTLIVEISPSDHQNLLIGNVNRPPELELLVQSLPLDVLGVGRDQLTPRLGTDCIALSLGDNRLNLAVHDVSIGIMEKSVLTYSVGSRPNARRLYDIGNDGLVKSPREQLHLHLLLVVEEGEDLVEDVLRF